MSRAKTICLTYIDFLQGSCLFRVPEGYKRLQVNAFVAPISNRAHGLALGNNAVTLGNLTKNVTQRLNIPGRSYLYTRNAQGNIVEVAQLTMNTVVQMVCPGLGGWRDDIASASTANPLLSGMQGNTYEITSKELVFIPQTLDGQIFNHTEMFFQFTLL